MLQYSLEKEMPLQPTESYWVFSKHIILRWLTWEQYSLKIPKTIQGTSFISPVNGSNLGIQHEQMSEVLTSVHIQLFICLFIYLFIYLFYFFYL